MLPDLPELVLNLVCSHLSYEDMLMLRSTCKGLKKFVDEKEFTKLNLFVRKYPFHHRLFYTDEPIGYPHSYHTNDQTIISSVRFRELFCNVQKMILCSNLTWSKIFEENVVDPDFYLSDLNFFEALNHLEVDQFSNIKGKLKLPELRIASFQTKMFHRTLESSFELDCSKLRALGIFYGMVVLTSETDQLEYLSHRNSDPGNRDYLKSISPNLQKLSTICFEWMEDLLQFLSDLRTGNLSMPSLNQIRAEHVNCLLLDELANSLQDLKRDSHRKHIKFILIGRPIHSPEELRQIASLTARFPFDHQWMIQDIRWLTDSSLSFLDETRELNFFFSAILSVNLKEDTELNEETIKKLKSIRSLEVRDQCQLPVSIFEMFIRNCKHIGTLTLHRQTVTKRLLKMMSEHMINLEVLRITGCKYETLKPLAKFQNLELLDLDFEPQRDELTFIFENSRTLQQVVIICQKVKWSIELLRTTMGPKVHKIILKRTHEIFEFSTLHSMIDYFYRKRLFVKRENHEPSTRLE